MCINIYMFYVYKYVYSHIFSYGSHFTLLVNNRLQYMLSISEIWYFLTDIKISKDLNLSINVIDL